VDLAGLLELRQRDDLVADGDARVHAVGEVGDVTLVPDLEQQPLAREGLRRDDEQVPGRLADGDVLALAYQPLLDDAPALNDADAKDLRLVSRPGGLAAALDRCYLLRHARVPLPCAAAWVRRGPLRRCPGSSA